MSDRTASELCDVEVEIESSLDLQSPSDFLFDIPSDDSFHHYLPFTVTGEGQHHFLFRLRSGSDDGYESRVLLEVSTPTASTQVINYTDARRIEGRVVVGTEGAQLRFDSGSEKGASETDEFVEVDLKPRRRVNIVQVKRPLPAFQHHCYEADRLSLHVRCGDSSFSVGLLSKPVVSLGRNRRNDIALRVLPPTQENDRRSQRISGYHAELEFAASGIAWRNLGRQGTMIDGRLLGEAEQSLLRQGTIVHAANVLSLGCELFYGNFIEGERLYDRFASRYGAGTIPNPVGEVRAVRLKRIDNLAGQEEYVIFQRVVTIGSGPSCALLLNHPSVSHIHAQIVRLGNSFWLEPLRTARPTLVNGQNVPLNYLVPLSPNLLLQFGDVEATVTHFQQYYLDNSPTA